MKYSLFLGVLLSIQAYLSDLSRASELSYSLGEDVLTVQNQDETEEYSSEVQSLYVDPPQQIDLDTSQFYYSIVNDLEPTVQYAIVEDDQVYNLPHQNIILNQASPVSLPIQIPMQGHHQGIRLGQGGKMQWLGGPVNFDNMVDCKFYRQNPGFCVPMSIYTPCSRCKAGVRTIFRTSYKVRCPGQDSFPPQLRPYFAWVPTSHRNPKRENKLFSRWRRQFMCIVMAISDVPADITNFWQHSQISFDSAADTPQSVPLLLGPYGDQSTSLGYTTGASIPVVAGAIQSEGGYSTQFTDGQNIYTIS
ncbi:signal peptide-containing secreted protein [Cryptosporidium canis]|uniref:Signal peptide-containing secreted protein n=1 Tax=Cryptosporidium canis TaxID=195482 RepID=A0A9D5DJF1_9CRYT|nr:signal peptide-containing secreted protein [Cryptosporidium canis]